MLASSLTFDLIEWIFFIYLGEPADSNANW